MPPSARRCRGPSSPRKWAPPRPSCAATWPRRLPGRSCTSIAATTSWASDRVCTMPPEPRNPFYFLLLFASVLFVVTALAYAVVPVLEEKARDAGEEPPPSAFRDALRQD